MIEVVGIFFHNFDFVLTCLKYALKLIYLQISFL